MHGFAQADQMNQTKELVKLSDGSDAGIRAIEPKLYSIQQQKCESPLYRTVKDNKSVIRRSVCTF